jgi:hypothetical protein
MDYNDVTSVVGFVVGCGEFFSEVRFDCVVSWQLPILYFDFS